MGRGKIKIERIENSTNRQVTYSKRRSGIMKKAHELTVLCEAEVSLIMFSSTGKLSEFISPKITTKQMFDKYQQVTGTNLWNSHYEVIDYLICRLREIDRFGVDEFVLINSQRMQENLNKLEGTNRKIRREIRHRIGEDLNDLSIDQLRSLEQEMENSLRTVRERKYHLIGSKTETYRKKEGRLGGSYSMTIAEEDYQQSAFHQLNEGSHAYSFRLQPSQPNLQDGGYGLHDLRLA
ncbi:hypothetical protein Scep_000576 [Stephania cephalantha]|uniref:Uncharacterized protein n=1 Tax=Stephania cephalantha TaxID=152367 RepID=A0AAP0Q323_9MAGN